MKHVDLTLKSTKKGTIYRSLAEWNDLSAEIRNIDTFANFKKTQKKWMMDKTINIAL